MPHSKSEKGFAHVAIFAVLIVVAVVGVAGYFLFLSKPQPVEAPQPKTQVAKPQELTLTLDSPTDGTVVTNNLVSVSGKTLPNTAVMIYADSPQQVSVDSDAQGMFKADLPLETGINTVTVTVFDDDGNENSMQIDVVNDTEGK